MTETHDEKPEISADDFEIESAADPPFARMKKWQTQEGGFFKLDHLPQAEQPSPANRLNVPLLDHIAGLLLGLIGFALVIATYSGIGWSWDEAYYYEPAAQAVQFVRQAVTSGSDSFNPFDSETIKQYWTSINEAPALCKFLLGFSGHYLEPHLGQIAALRFPSAVMFGLTLYLIYLVTTAYYGRFAGLVAVIVYISLPRVFGHAHFAATETTINFILALSIYCFIRGLTSAPWAVIWGIVFGLALNTKINAVLIPVIILPWAVIFRRAQSANNLFAMLLLSPLIWVLTWPWLWDQTVVRILDFIEYFAAHQVTGVWYLGTKYGFDQPPAPWHYPLVMTAFTTPLIPMLLFCVGIIRALAKSRLEHHGLLFLFYIVVTLVVASRPSAAKYDGVRLFLSMFPFFAILAGAGAAGILRTISAESISANSPSLTWRKMAGAVLIAVLLLFGALSLALAHPRYISYYNILAGGVKGAHKIGLETTYWCDALNRDVVEYLNSELPQDASIKTLAMHDQALVQLQDIFQELRADLTFPPQPPFDVHILQHRKGFFRGTEEAIVNSLEPDKQFLLKGIPLISVYLTPGGITRGPGGQRIITGKTAETPDSAEKDEAIAAQDTATSPSLEDNN